MKLDNSGRQVSHLLWQVIKKPWGMVEFAILDGDGDILKFDHPMAY